MTSEQRIGWMERTGDGNGKASRRSQRGFASILGGVREF